MNMNINDKWMGWWWLGHRFEINKQKWRRWLKNRVEIILEIKLFIYKIEIKHVS
jgi:hypothetical protein